MGIIRYLGFFFVLGWRAGVATLSAPSSLPLRFHQPPAFPDNGLVVIASSIPRIHILLGRLHRIRHEFAPWVHRIVCVLLHCRFPRVHILLGRLHHIRHKFCPRGHIIACFCCIFVSHITFSPELKTGVPDLFLRLSAFF